MKKEWKDIEGLPFRVDVGSTTAQAMSDDVPASVLCLTTDGEVVINGVRYYADHDERITKNAADIATNAEGIAANASAVAKAQSAADNAQETADAALKKADANAKDIDSIEISMDNVESVNAEQTAAIAKNASDIATNAENIGKLKERVNDAEDNIANNTAHIEQNAKKLNDPILYRFSKPGYASTSTGGTIYLTGQYTTLGSGIDRTKETGGTAYSYGALQLSIPSATSTANGLMSASDKSALDNIGEEIIQKADEADLAQLKEEVAQKVDKVSGKGLSTNDFTDAYKKKVNGYSMMPYINGEVFVLNASQIQNVGITGDGETSEVSSIGYSSSLNTFLVSVGLKTYNAWSGFINVPDSSIYTKEGLANTPLYNTIDHKLYWYDGEKLNSIGGGVSAEEFEELKKLLTIA